MIPLESQSLFRKTLQSGRFNLLVGAGISLTSRNELGAELESVGMLRDRLCDLKGLRKNSSLGRAAKSLSSEEVQTHVFPFFRVAKPGNELVDLFRFPWRRIFTLNIDDALEVAHALAVNKCQFQIRPTCFDDTFVEERDPDVVPIIHLHGFVGKPESGIVFSHEQYGSIIADSNVWAVVLSQIIGSEPFIVAGTSLDEPDLEYFLRFRNTISIRQEWGPSLLVEPFPDAGVSLECARHQLNLVESRFADFVAWLKTFEPNVRPMRSRIYSGLLERISTSVASDDLRLFLEDFEQVPGVVGKDETPTTEFPLGALPTWADIALNSDLDRTSYAELAVAARNETGKLRAGRKRLILITGRPGEGKSTALFRTAFELARDGEAVFLARQRGRVNIKSAVACLSAIGSVPILVVDGLAEVARDLSDLTREFSGQLLVVASERDYRVQYARSILEESTLTIIPLNPLGPGEIRRITKSYNDRGLLANRTLMDKPHAAPRMLGSDPVAVIVCRLLNKFDSLDRILRESWRDASVNQRRAYIICALAYSCRQQGVKVSILQAAAQVSIELGLGSSRNSLPLIRNPIERDLVVPINGTIAEQMLKLMANDRDGIVLDAFARLGEALSPWVNIHNIGLRSPESRIAARLFNADDVVLPLLKDSAAEFFARMEPIWKWHSQFWAQRALLLRHDDREKALQFARHAQTMEPDHPFTSNTLAALLFGTSESDFDEGFDYAVLAIAQSRRRRWANDYPYNTLFANVLKHLSKGYSISFKQKESLRSLLSDRPWPPSSRAVEEAASRLANYV